MKTKTYPVALNLPQVVALFIVFGRHVVQSMTGNPWFPSPNPPLATVTSDLDALEVSEATARTRAKGAASVRDEKRRVVEDHLMMLKIYVQLIANQNPEHAISIIDSAGMSLKNLRTRLKPALQALMSVIQGEVLLRAKSAGRGAAYEWAYSADGGKTWVALPLTNHAKTIVQGLTLGTVYQFRFRTTVKNVTSAWSDTISFLVH
jgi:hypothetical protein